MSAWKLTRRELLKAVTLVAAGTVAAACAPQAPAAPGEQVDTAPAPEEVAKTFHILHWAQSAEPTDPNVELEPGEVRKVAYQKVAEEYMDLHPGVEIEWYRFPAGSSVSEWLLARMTAQDAPDIYWTNTEDLWPHIPKGWALDFTPYMDLPNPYVEGNTAWKDQFEEVAIISQTGPDGKLYGVNMDGAGVLTVYNKDAFEKAGITEEPRTWSEFIDVWEQLLDAGYIPYGADLSEQTCCFPHWLSAHVYNQLVWDTIYEWDLDDNKVITAKDLALSFQAGTFPDWEAYLQFAHLFKEMTPYFPMGYEGQVDYRQLFRQEQVVMYMDGNWAVSEFKNDPPPFAFSWLAFPIITKDIWPAAPEKVVRIQGAWGAMQYHVPGYLSSQPEKVDVIMDWLMFSSMPEHVGDICKETGLVPLTKGAQGLPELAPFYEPYDRAVPYQSWQTLSSSGLTAEYELWQQYLPSDMTDSEFLDLANSKLEAEVDKVLEANPDWAVS